MKWSELKLVQLKELVEKEEWFQLSNGKTYLDEIEGNFDANNLKPNNFSIHLEYEGHGVEICIQWNKEKYYVTHTPRYERGRAKSSKRIEKTVKNILDAYTDAMEAIDKALICKKEEEQRKLRIATWRRKVIDEINLKEQEGIYANYNSFSFRFPLSKNFALSFTSKEIESSKVQQIQLNGDFEINDIKSLIGFLSENPKIMADRLIQGK